MDSRIHREYTGRPNELILENARLVIASGRPTVFRMPIIPGVNDTPSNIHQTGDFLKNLGVSAHHIDLLPYHRLGMGKYEALGRRYRMRHLVSPDPDRVEVIKKSFEAMGLECSVSG
jgi:pyruvate formate lyase activating enzyme